MSRPVMEAPIGCEIGCQNEGGFARVHHFPDYVCQRQGRCRRYAPASPGGA